MGTEYDLLTGALDIRQGYETDDKLLTEQAYKKLWPWLNWGESVNQAGDLPSVLAGYPGWPRMHFPVVATQKFDTVRLVMWFSPKMNRFTPALYCPDIKTGVFVKATLRARSCPHCENIFISDKKNAIYCSISHREAHRMARYRHLKKIKEAKKHGPRKTR